MNPCTLDAYDRIPAELAAFLREELASMADNVAEHFAENMENRKLNPFLVFEDESIPKYMALGRSLDAQLGNRIQRMLFRITRMRYGTLHVPNLVAIDITDASRRAITCRLYSVPFDLPTSEQNTKFDPYQQKVCIGFDRDTKHVKRLLKVKASSDSLLTAAFRFENIPEAAFQFLTAHKQKTIPVDLLFFDSPAGVLDGGNAFEVKMGGNLDTKNAKSNAGEVKDLSILFSFLPHSKAWFATCYGVCSSAVVAEMEAAVGKGHILNNRTFWDQIIPEGENRFTYDDFIAAFRQAFVASGLETKMKRL